MEGEKEKDEEANEENATSIADAAIVLLWQV